MSGPKYSTFVTGLNVVIKAYSNQQLQERIEQADEQTKRTKKIYENYENKLKQIPHDLTKKLMLLNETSIDQEAYKKIKKLIDTELKNLNLEIYYKFLESLKAQVCKTGYDITNKLQNAELGFKTLLTIYSRVENRINNEVAKIKEQYHIDTIIKESNDEPNPIEPVNPNRPNDNFSTKDKIEIKFIDLPPDFFSQESDDTFSESDLLDIKLKLNKIESYINFYHTSDQIENRLMTIYTQLNELVNSNKEKTKVIEMIKSEYDNFLFLAPHIEDMEREYQIYLEKLKEIKEITGLDYEKYGSLESLDKIKYVYSQIEREFETSGKDEYISNAIKEVMTDLGYDVLRSDILVQDNNQSYFDYDGQAAISIYHNDQGAVVMELVATGDESEMTENEKKIHLEKMENFCHKYPRIISALERKGIIIKKDAEMPVDKAFIKKVTTVKGQKKQYQQQKRYLG